jgi:chromate transporter
MPHDAAVAGDRTQPPRAKLGDLAGLFLRLGVTAFGGPAAHIALMENEVVRRRRWLSSERFLDLLGAANLIPGPSSTELALFIGYDKAGWRGLLLAGSCFIVPAALMVSVIAWAYVRFGALPQVGGVLYGVKPVEIAIIVQAFWALAPKALKRSPVLVAVGLLAAVAAAFGVDALAVLVGAGAASVVAARALERGETRLLGLAAVGGAGGSAGIVAIPVSLVTLFFTFVKFGAVVFGGGYVLLAFLRDDLVDRLRWLSESQLLDAVAVGQVTPGPVFTTATFIGYVIAGGWGAALATVGIFLPGFVLVAASRPLLARVRRSAWASAFLDGVNVASLALMAVVTFQLAKSTFVDVPTVLIGVACAVLLLLFRVNSAWLVCGGAVAGTLLRGLR